MNTLIFRNTVLETVFHNGKIWFTSAMLAKAHYTTPVVNLSQTFKTKIPRNFRRACLRSLNRRPQGIIVKRPVFSLYVVLILLPCLRVPL